MRTMFKPQAGDVSATQSNDPRSQQSSSSLPANNLLALKSVMELVSFPSDDSESSDGWDFESASNDGYDNSGNTPIHPLQGPVEPNLQCTSSLITPSIPEAASSDVIAAELGRGAAGRANVHERKLEASTGAQVVPLTSCRTGLLPRVPPFKRRKLDISYWEARELNKQGRWKEMERAWETVRKLLASKKTNFVSGQHGLQA